MEEPIEPPPPEECRLRIVGGARTLDVILADLKESFYEYNRSIGSTGYYLKPVHKVYKYVGGSRRIYEYYGRYWWRLSRTGKGPSISMLAWLNLRALRWILQAILWRGSP